MHRRRLAGLLLGASLWSTSAGAQQQNQPVIEITYERALELARTQAPALLAAHGRAREAESRVDAAAVWRFNPELSGSVGPRYADGNRTLDWSVGAQQWLELGGQRGDRVEAARAGAAAGNARRDDARRLLLREVSLAFAMALYWQRRIALAEEELRIAEAIAATATRRSQLGDLGGLDVSVSALAVARAQSSADRARAERTRAVGRLKALLGIAAATELTCNGDLRRLGINEENNAERGERPDVEALHADIRRAEAVAELGRAGGVPNLAVGVGYAREESADIVRGSLALTLPVFDHGQGTSVVAEARGDRLRTELEATRSAASVEAGTARAVAQRLSAAAVRFEEGGQSTLERAEKIATASYDAGAIPLGELLAVRRELVQTKVDHADLLLEAANARIELASSTGALR